MVRRSLPTISRRNQLQLEANIVDAVFILTALGPTVELVKKQVPLPSSAPKTSQAIVLDKIDPSLGKMRRRHRKGWERKKNKRGGMKDDCQKGVQLL